MKTKRSSVFATILMLIIGLTSCSNIELIAGNGKIVKKEIDVKNFRGLDVSAGIEASLTQDSFELVTIETDENMLEYIKFEVKDGILHIYRDGKWTKPSKLKISVTAINIEKLFASSGSGIHSTNVIKTDYLEMDASSAADITLNINAKYVVGNASSGADITLSGEALVFNATASSGSDIKGKELQTGTAKANASSGADISMQVKEEIIAEASSGGDVKVYGTPLRREVHSSSGGDVTFESKDK